MAKVTFCFPMMALLTTGREPLLFIVIHAGFMGRTTISFLLCLSIIAIYSIYLDYYKLAKVLAPIE